MNTPKCPAHGTNLERRNGKYGAFYGCPHYPACDVIASKSNHDGQWHVSDASTRKMRIKAHEAFDRAWSAAGISRGRAYKMLAEMLGLAQKDCHIQHFDAATCEKVIGLSPLIRNWPRTMYPQIEIGGDHDRP